MAKATPQPVLPKRFQPFLQQAQTETAIRYGGQEAAIQSILGQTTHDYQQSQSAIDTARRETAGLLAQNPGQLKQLYADVGLGPNAQLANSPTGQRVAGELASAQASLLQQRNGINAGYDYQAQHARDQYGQDVGKIGSQLTALEQEKGQYGSSLLDQLISGDRSARHDANLAAAKQAFTAQQNRENRAASTDNALIGAGINPTTGGTLPPRATVPKPTKRTTGPGTASADAQRKYGSSFQSALAAAQHAAAGEGGQPGLIDSITSVLTSGQKASPAKPPTTKQVRVLNADGTQKTDAGGKPIYKTVTTPGTTGTTAQPSYDQVVAQAAAEQAVDGYVHTGTVRALQKLGYSARQIPGLVTQTQYHQVHQPQPKRPGSVTAPGPAGTRGNRPG